MSTPTTPYRNEIAALHERRSALQAEIDKLREQTTQLDELRAREQALAGELASVEGRLAEGAVPTRRALPLLDQVRVASPCNAEWNEMVGDERVRFCLSCAKNVYNLSMMPREDAEALLRERVGGEMCVRFYERSDGTILTQDCPVGAKKKRRKALALAVAGAGAMAAAAATMFTRATCRQGDMRPIASPVSIQEQVGTPKMGEFATVPPVAPVPTEQADDATGRWTAGKRAAPPPPPPVKMGKMVRTNRK